MFLVYDTETTGMPIWGEPSESPNQPRIIQLAAILMDDEYVRRGAMDVLIISGGGYEIDPEAAALHGITTEMMDACGVDISTALEMFFSLWGHADTRVGHNESFDARMVRIEMLHPEMEGLEVTPEEWKAGESFCTMHKSRPIVALPPTDKMKGGFKVPDLYEAFGFFTGERMTGAHNAWHDVLATIEVYKGIQDFGK